MTGPSVPGHPRSFSPVPPLSTSPIVKATNLHHGASPARARPAPVRRHPVGQHNHRWSRPDTAGPDSGRRAAAVEG